MKKNEFYEQIGVAMTCRSFEEYVRMFSLDETSLSGKRILDVASGASSFSARCAAKGVDAEAVDPLYSLTNEEMADHGSREIDVSTHKLSAIKEKFCWDYYGSLEDHRAAREQSLNLFLQDYADPNRSSRYYTGCLPNLLFPEESFDLILCSHFLFLYEEQFDYDFHLQSIRELLRVCRKSGEIRIYPLSNLRWSSYPFLDLLRSEIEQEGAVFQLLDSALPFIPDSMKLLTIRKEF